LKITPSRLKRLVGPCAGTRLRQHRELILNYFRAQKLISSGVVEGLHNKANVTMRKSYGFRTYRVLDLPSITHLASCRSRNSPTISSDEFFKQQHARCAFLPKPFQPGELTDAIGGLAGTVA
jgi:hypothetical protein